MGIGPVRGTVVRVKTDLAVSSSCTFERYVSKLMGGTCSSTCKPHTSLFAKCWSRFPEAEFSLKTG
eukprot:2112450-Amphidinium_carterae.1